MAAQIVPLQKRGKKKRGTGPTIKTNKRTTKFSTENSKKHQVDHSHGKPGLWVDYQVPAWYERLIASTFKNDLFLRKSGSSPGHNHNHPMLTLLRNACVIAAYRHAQEGVDVVHSIRGNVILHAQSPYREMDKLWSVNRSLCDKDSMRKRNTRDTRFCEHMMEDACDCSVQNRAGLNIGQRQRINLIAIHSLYYLDPLDILQALVDHSFGDHECVMYGVTHVFRGDSGFIIYDKKDPSRSEGSWRRTVGGNQVVMDVNQGRPFCHSDMDWIQSGKPVSKVINGKLWKLRIVELRSFVQRNTIMYEMRADIVEDVKDYVYQSEELGWDDEMHRDWTLFNGNELLKHTKKPGFVFLEDAVTIERQYATTQRGTCEYLPLIRKANGVVKARGYASPMNRILAVKLIVRFCLDMDRMLQHEVFRFYMDKVRSRLFGLFLRCDSPWKFEIRYPLWLTLAALVCLLAVCAGYQTDLFVEM